MSAASNSASVWASRLPLGMTSFSTIGGWYRISWLTAPGARARRWAGPLLQRQVDAVALQDPRQPGGHPQPALLGDVRAQHRELPERLVEGPRQVLLGGRGQDDRLVGGRLPGCLDLG